VGNHLPKILIQELPNRLPQKISVVMPALPHLLSCYAACSSFLFDKPDACLPVSSMSVSPLVSRPPPQAHRRWSPDLLHERATTTGLLVKPFVASSSSPSARPRQASPPEASPTTTSSLITPTTLHAHSVSVPHAGHTSDRATSLENTRREHQRNY
jgi:hypothetical protein